MSNGIIDVRDKWTGQWCRTGADGETKPRIDSLRISQRAGRIKQEEPELMEALLRKAEAEVAERLEAERLRLEATMQMEAARQLETKEQLWAQSLNNSSVIASANANIRLLNRAQGELEQDARERRNRATGVWVGFASRVSRCRGSVVSV